MSKTGVFEHLAHAPTMADCERAGRKASPSGVVLCAQAVRSSFVGVKGEHGYDPARRVVNRQHHALTDIDGCLLLTTVSTADRHDSHGGVALLQASRRLRTFLAYCFADQAYQGERVGNGTAITFEIIRPDKGQKGFAVQLQL